MHLCLPDMTMVFKWHLTLGKGLFLRKQNFYRSSDKGCIRQKIHQPQKCCCTYLFVCFWFQICFCNCYLSQKCSLRRWIFYVFAKHHKKPFFQLDKKCSVQKQDFDAAPGTEANIVRHVTCLLMQLHTFRLRRFSEAL